MSTYGDMVSELEQLMREHPRKPGEESIDWFDRLRQVQIDEIRLPYREPGEDDE